MFKRIGLFLLVNIAVMVTVSTILQILGVTSGVTRHGINWSHLAIFCLIWGTAGSFISLFISKWMAKMTMGVQIIDPQSPKNSAEAQIVATVTRLSQEAGLRKLPEIGIYQSPDPNAFATGPSKNNSLVAVSTGLLHSMNKREVDAVLAHEIAHVANGDMVTLALVQGVVNAFVMFIARVIGFFASQSAQSEESAASIRFAVTLVCELVLGVFGAMVVAAFSRYREFRADAGAAKLNGKESMIGALQALQRTYGMPANDGPQSLAAFKISGKKGGFLSLFSTHPPLEERIERLRSLS